MSLKQYFGRIARQLNLASVADNARFVYLLLKNYSKNKKAKRSLSEFVFPPDYFMYETYQLNYKAYYSDGFQTAKEIIQLFSQFIALNVAPNSVLDWGCGPGRIVRHLPNILGPGYKIEACDYNPKYVDWCARSIVGVNFSKNDLKPPTLFKTDTFDAIYALSIITHLSAESHYEWVNELLRILKPGGVLMITSQGKAFSNKLLPGELSAFNEGNLVVRESKNEGHRIYSAFQPSEFMKQLLRDFTILKLIPGGSKDSILGLQDTWVLQKPLP